MDAKETKSNIETRPPHTPEEWIQRIHEHFESEKPNPSSLVKAAMKAFPEDGRIAFAAVLAALIENQPEQALRNLQFFKSRWRLFGIGDQLAEMIAAAQLGQWAKAYETIEKYRLRTLSLSLLGMPFAYSVKPWLESWIKRIREENKRLKAEQAKVQKQAAKAAAKNKPPKKPPVKAAEPEIEVPPLVFQSTRIPVSLHLPKIEDVVSKFSGADTGAAAFRLRADFARLSLLQGFDELLCLPLLHNIATYWYQVETVRKVLKQFRGRVLLADEVGLGKTVEAGMVLKEYVLRGMVERVLILTPATLVGQWTEEMESKFDLTFASTYDPLVRTDPAAFWKQPRVIASIAAARRAEHFEILSAQRYDMVIVDEAHHLKNRATANWKLVDALQKRFLLLLSATPVQNSLVELYNLLTLLKPGIFKTEKEFRANYMATGKPRVPANRERMRDLMRDVMIRNTRALVDVKLPLRHAVTLKLDAGPGEADAYAELNRLVREMHEKGTTHHRLALRHLLSAAGSSPVAAAKGIHRFMTSNKLDKPWKSLHDRYAALTAGCKETALLDVLRRNPDERKMVFVHHRETLDRLSSLLALAGLGHARFEGAMTGPEKDRAVERFRDEVPILLCTESGGEGRNLQFCNTLVNFDLPWNPMAIEQRIGRLHRIGQAREVFVFNLAVRDTIEEKVLRILDEKINMFELVVGEIDAILGEMDEAQDFAEMVFAAWVQAGEREREKTFETIGERLVEAKRQYEAVKSYDEELFGDEFTTS